ncbi:MAG: CDP-alcohol phosphatidyltransferase family protein [Firmicutes bacterium]|jgi:cardiolipin synthase|nr:CDP-alcohol phosphatidyltransferase family protein [Bacillota bacterium]
MTGGNITIPNFITSVRIVLIAFFSLSLLVFSDKAVALAILMSIGLTDFLDGFLARRLGQESQLGKLLDPVADRLAIITCVATLGADSYMPAALMIAILIREFLISFGALLVMLRGDKLLDVSLIGKAATFGLYISLPFFVVSHIDVVTNSGLSDAGEWIATISLVAMFVATYNYGMQIFNKEKDEGALPNVS